MTMDIRSMHVGLRVQHAGSSALKGSVVHVSTAGKVAVAWDGSSTETIHPVWLVPEDRVPMTCELCSKDITETDQYLVNEAPACNQCWRTTQ